VAQVVYGIGSSHSPQLNLPADSWHIRGEADKRITDLIGTDGIVSNYEGLLTRLGEDDMRVIAKEISPDTFERRHAENQAAIAKLSEALYRVNPDVIVMLGDDQQEYLRDDNMPGMCVYWGDDVLVRAIPSVNGVASLGKANEDLRVPTDGKLGRHIIEYMVEADFDVGRSSFLEGGRANGGIGHAFSYVYHRLMTEQVIPTIPIMVNTYYPPNQPTPKRCYDFGRTLRSAIESWPGKARVAVLASGGLSHFVVDEDFDQACIDAIKSKDVIKFAQLPRGKLNSGNSEVRNWIVLAGATEHLDLDYLTYVPCYRSEAGTGCAMAFAEWC
jgi:3-O-methylgallate 3,4-dioxygenase